MNNGMLGGVSGPLVSQVYAIPASGSAFVLKITHGRGRKPSRVRWRLVCKSAELGFVSGDQVDVISAYFQGRPPTMNENGTVVTLACSAANNSIELVNQTTGANGGITYSHWGIRAYIDFA